jgi:hypothetical protein
MSSIEAKPIGEYKNQPVYIKDILNAYSGSDIPIETYWEKFGFKNSVFDNPNAYFRIPKCVQSPEYFKGAIVITECVNWQEFVRLPIKIGIIMMFKFFQENLQETYMKKAPKIMDRFGGIIVIVYPKMYGKGDKTFWAHHVQQIFKSDPNGPGELSKYM